MTSIVSRSPAVGAQSVGPRPHIVVALAGTVLEPVTQAEVNIDIDGRPAVVGGFARSGFEVSYVTNTSFGFDITLRPLLALSDNAWHGVRVRANGLDDGWSFRVSELTGPYIFGLTPTLGSSGAIQLPLVEFDIVDDTHGVAKRVQVAESDAGVLSGSQLTVPDMDLRRSLGRVVEVGGTPGFVTGILGPHIVTLSISGGGSGLNVKLFKDAGLDVTIDGAKVIQGGEVVTGLGWTTTLTEPTAGKFHVAAQKTGSNIALGKRVDIHVRASDANTDAMNVSDAHAHFHVGDLVPPRIKGVSPVPGTRGIATATSTQPVIDIVDPLNGVTQASINVTVSGVAAITAGAGVGIYASSTVNAISDGFRVTLIRSTAWPSAMEVPVHVQAADAAGNVTHASWLWHFGTTTEDIASDATADQVRVRAFDFAQTSFARPADMKHTGFAWDGYYYEKGAKTTTRASWAAEATSANRAVRDEFPVAGFVSARADGWDILDAAGVMWMKCTRLGSGSTASWSAAGSNGQTIRDVFMASDRPALFVAVDNMFLVVDFTIDRAARINAGGRQMGLAAGLSTRNNDQANGAIDPVYALFDDAAPFTSITGLAWDTNWIVVGTRLAQVEMAGDLSAFAADATAARGPGGVFGPHSVMLPIQDADAGSAVRSHMIRQDPKQHESLVVGILTGADPALAIIDWLGTFSWLQGVLTMSTSGFGAGQVRDIDQMIAADGSWMVAWAIDSFLFVYAFEPGTFIANVRVAAGMAALTLNSVASSIMSCVAMDRALDYSSGYVFVGCAAAADGKAVRYRHQRFGASTTGQVVTMMSGAPVRTLATLGESRITDHRFVRASMMMTSLDECFVRASMVTE